MTPELKKKLLSVVIVPRATFDEARFNLWGLTDDSRTVFSSMKDPLIINGATPHAERLLELLLEAMAQPYFLEYDRADEIMDEITDYIGNHAAGDILKMINERHRHIATEEAIDRARAFVAAHDIEKELDEISPDPCYWYFHQAVKDLDTTADATFLYGYLCGRAAGEGAQV